VNPPTPLAAAPDSDRARQSVGYGCGALVLAALAVIGYTLYKYQESLESAVPAVPTEGPTDGPPAAPPAPPDAL